jgi:curved DNA-binding protein
VSVKYKDYYEVLGVPHNAGDDVIRKAYRKLTREYHPDVNKSPDSKERFQEISEAYEVLGDPKKRERYDQLGANWKHGQNFSPPPGGDDVHFKFHKGAQGFSFADRSGFSDFFESLFGDMLGRNSSHFRSADAFDPPPQRRTHDEAELTLTLEEAFHGGKKRIQIHSDAGASPRNCELNIPPGIREGAKLRLRNQGPYGDLLIRISIAPHPRFKVNGADLETEVPLTPPQAVLGASVGLQLIDGHATLRIPPGTQPGRKFRLTDKGLKKPGGERGDLYAVAKLIIPQQPSSKEKKLYEQLAELSKVNPKMKGGDGMP